LNDRSTDIFTGHAAQTALMNERVPSKQGVTVVLDAPRCARIAREVMDPRNR
jgi:hypothetical protein